MFSLSRRAFTKTAAASSVYSLLPSQAQAPSKTINLAIIGCGGQGAVDAQNFFKMPEVKVVALCDVQFGTEWTKAVEGKCPDAKKFQDFRKMFDTMGKDIDACLIATPDHAHFPIAMLAMSLGKAVYVEKPLAHTYDECRRLMAAEQKYKVVTQMGNQGHSGANYFQFDAWTKAGIIKDVTKITAYMNSKRRWHGWEIAGFDKGGKVPAGMDWDTWLGTAMENDFSAKLHPGDWRSWFAYGNGAFGDWGPHILDTCHRFLKLGMPSKITAEKRDGANEFIFPQASTIRFDFPEREGMPACAVTWHDGVNNVPEAPPELEGGKLEANGKLIYGNGLIFKGRSHGDPLTIIPKAKLAELAPTLPKVTGKNSSHYENFAKAVLGEEQTRSPFSVSAPLSQVFCLGVICQRLGGEIAFDAKTESITNNDLAHKLLVGPPPRKGWEQFYNL
jgi:predicted dehydrogenase